MSSYDKGKKIARDEAIIDCSYYCFLPGEGLGYI